MNVFIFIYFYTKFYFAEMKQNFAQVKLNFSWIKLSWPQFKNIKYASAVSEKKFRSEIG